MSASFLEVFDRRYAPLLGGRAPTFRAVIEALEQQERTFYTLVETGIGHLAGADGQPAFHAVHGHSTLVFDAFLRAHDGVLYTVDHTPAHCAIARTWLSEKTRIFCQESRTFLAAFDPPQPIDCLYLDTVAIDWNDPHPTAHHYLSELCAILPRLREGCIVFTDDTVNGIGSAGYMTELMERIGAELLFDAYQVGWRLGARRPKVRPFGQYGRAELEFLLARPDARAYRFVAGDGSGERAIELLPDGTIGRGRTGDEDRWFVEAEEDRVELILAGRGRTTARLQQTNGDHWRGVRTIEPRGELSLIPMPVEAIREGRYRFHRDGEVRSLELGAFGAIAWGHAEDGELWRIERGADASRTLVFSSGGADRRSFAELEADRWYTSDGARIEYSGSITEAELRTRERLIGTRLYRWSGPDRVLELLPMGRIGRGNGALARAWEVEDDGEGDVALLIHGTGGRTLRAFDGGDGTWFAKENLIEPFSRSGGSYSLPYFTACLPRTGIGRIVEVGSGDGADAIALQKRFGGEVIAFECNPELVSRCREAIAGRPGMTFVDRAVGAENGTVQFLRVTNGNVHASSCYPANPEYPYERYQQEAIAVEMVRLDTWLEGQAIAGIDLLALDVQGGTLPVLRGLGAHLDRVRYVIAELDTRPIYRGEALAPEVIAFLEERGFFLLRSFDQWGVTPQGALVTSPFFDPRYAGAESWFGDFLFVRPTEREAAAALELTHRSTHRLRRLDGGPEQKIELLPRGVIEGGHHWVVHEQRDGNLSLSLLGFEEVSHRFHRGYDGRWRGRSLDDDTSPLILEPWPAKTRLSRSPFTLERTAPEPRP